MERQQHTNPWAEKLFQVSMPDSGAAWTSMEAILDREMPVSGARDRRRWVLFILLLLLLIGVCNCPGRGRFFHNIWSTHKSVPSQQAVTPAAPSAPAGPAVTPATLSTPPAATPPVTSGGPAAPASPATAFPATVAALTPGLRSPHHRNVKPEPAYSDADTTRSGHRSGKIPDSKHRHGGSKPANPALTDARPGTDATRPGTDTTRSAGATTPAGTIPSAGAGTPTTARPTVADTPVVAPKKAAPQKPVSKAVPKATLKDSTHKKPPPKPQEPPPPEKQNGWVAGIGLNQFFPIGGQQGSTFNSNGLTGTLSDYLPVPMVRYYFTPRLYLQLEAQFNTPQATKKNLVISQPVPDTSSIRGSRIASSASLRQLYYFNIPLSIHYSPWENVDIGAGLQFSHLSNAIGDFDSTITNTSSAAVTNAKAIKSFKGDSLYQHIRTNEFRFMLDASYTYKHFVFGLRYNQALSNFVNVQFASGQATQSRNSSLQIYVRYILFDSRKKKDVSAPK